MRGSLPSHGIDKSMHMLSCPRAVLIPPSSIIISPKGHGLSGHLQSITLGHYIKGMILIEPEEEKAANVLDVFVPGAEGQNL